mmetsp:Transcript_3627/g.11541  ORF Transcript_3627/g.11541 Transcript_3627/m.11541 type:complete len:139 (-) Transcript_3627:2406-2822(-)|eukprot:scaffold9618_cov27-Tisochrysis_lutea.AAC.3
MAGPASVHAGATAASHAPRDAPPVSVRPPGLPPADEIELRPPLRGEGEDVQLARESSENGGRRGERIAGGVERLLGRGGANGRGGLATGEPREADSAEKRAWLARSIEEAQEMRMPPVAERLLGSGLLPAGPMSPLAE